jgi:translation initiation factor RLI1
MSKINILTIFCFFLAGSLGLGALGVNEPGQTKDAPTNPAFISPGRIISLGPVLTEELYLLGAEDKLVGDTTYCINPPAAQNKPKIGSVTEFDLEKVISLKPDLVLATSLSNQDQVEKLKFKDRSLSELSGGERQLVFIACALAQEPRVLLLDEPTNHLDIAHQVHILDLLKRLQKDQGLSVILVLHDLNLASEYCSRLVLLKDGSVFKTGTPHTVLDYQTIETVYNTPVVAQRNPFSAKPYIMIVSEEEKSKKTAPKHIL